MESFPIFLGLVIHWRKQQKPLSDMLWQGTFCSLLHINIQKHKTDV